MNARWSIWDSHKKMQTWLRLGECDMVVNFLDQAMFIRSSNYTFHWNHNEKPLWYLFSPAQVAPIFSEFQGMVVNSGDLLISLLYFMPLSCLSNTKCAYNGVYYCPCGAHGLLTVCSRFAHGFSTSWISKSMSFRGVLTVAHGLLTVCSWPCSVIKNNGFQHILIEI